MIMSDISAGNMHPNLPWDEVNPQAQFDAFCNDNGIDSSTVIGIRVDPSWTDGARIATDVSPYVIPGSVNCDERQQAHALVVPKNIGVFMLTADCHPLVILGSEHHAVAHVSWRSVDGNLIGMLVDKLVDIGYEPQSLSAHLGAGIGKESNVRLVDETEQLLSDNNNTFWSNFAHHVTQETVQIDLPGAIVEQMKQSGIPHTGISLDERDTFSDPYLFSRRASLQEGLKPRGNQAFIAPAVV